MMRRRMRVALVAAAVMGGLVVWPASPVAAEEYDGTCNSVFVTDGVWEVTSGDSQAEPGGTFTLSNLRVQSHTSAGGSGGTQHLVVSVGDLDGQIIDLGSSFTIQESGPEFGNRVWDEVPPFELDAPGDLETYPITAELIRYGFPNLSDDIDCEFEGEPFAEVVVSDDPPPTTTTTTTTTTTVPDSNGDNGDENGGGSLGEEAEEEAVDEVIEELAEDIGAAERPPTVGATPRFTG